LRLSAWPPLPHAAILRSPSHFVKNPTTWFKLGATRDAGPGFGRAIFYRDTLAPAY